MLLGNTLKLLITFNLNCQMAIPQAGIFNLSKGRLSRIMLCPDPKRLCENSYTPV
jgi:hypothetical protein